MACNCYAKGDKKEPDLMWNLDLYARLDMADAWAIIGPIKLVCAFNKSESPIRPVGVHEWRQPDEKTINHKNPEKAIELEKTDAWKQLSQNHLEGRTAGFFCYGDQGGDELDSSGRPKILAHKTYFDPEQEPFENERDAYAPLVWQCRYGGVEVPDALWQYGLIGEGKEYSAMQAEHMVQEDRFMQQFDAWTEAFARFVEHKRKSTP
jgi:hypothetical protein